MTRVEPHVVNEDRWAAVPEALLYDNRICAEAVRVYGVLRRHGEDPTNCYPSHRRIAELIGKKQRSIPAWIRQLEQAGWIERSRRITANGDPDSNGYMVFGRARERGVRAAQRGGYALDDTEGCALHSAPKESNEEREQFNDSSAAPALADAEWIEREATQRITARRAKGERIGSGLARMIRGDVEKEAATRSAAQERARALELEQQRSNECDRCDGTYLKGTTEPGMRAIRCHHGDGNEAQAS